MDDMDAQMDGMGKGQNPIFVVTLHIKYNSVKTSDINKVRWSTKMGLWLLSFHWYIWTIHLT